MTSNSAPGQDTGGYDWSENPPPIIPTMTEGPQRLIPSGGYFELALPDRFTLDIQDRPRGRWATWATGLERDWFERLDDGSYLCTAHGGGPIYLRALSIEARGVFEHVDGDGFGRVYRYRLRPESEDQ